VHCTTVDSDAPEDGGACPPIVTIWSAQLPPPGPSEMLLDHAAGTGRDEAPEAAPDCRNAAMLAHGMSGSSTS